MSLSGQPAKPRFDYDEGDIHRTFSAGRALSRVQAAFWTAVLRDELGATSVRRVLDLGCGVGRFSRLLGEALGARVHGVGETGIPGRDRQHLRGPVGIPFVRATAEVLPFRAGGMDPGCPSSRPPTGSTASGCPAGPRWHGPPATRAWRWRAGGP